MVYLSNKTITIIEKKIYWILKSGTKGQISQLQSHRLKYINQQLPVGILESTPLGRLEGLLDGLPIK